MLALSVIVVPLALAGTDRVAIPLENNRSIKLDLIERLRRSPDILILGSSRARHAEPAYLQKLTGRTGFNAAVTGGGAPDAWVMSHCLADRFPAKKQRYLWFLSVGIAGDTIHPQLAGDARSQEVPQQYRARLQGPKRPRRASGEALPARRLDQHGVAALCVRARQAASASEVRSKADREHPPEPVDAEPRAPARAFRADARIHEPPRGPPGARPEPDLSTVLAELEKYGFPGRQAAFEYLDGLRARFDFVLVDCQDISRWGGSPEDFTSATHVNRANMRRMLVYIAANSQGAFR